MTSLLMPVVFFGKIVRPCGGSLSEVGGTAGVRGFLSFERSSIWSTQNECFLPSWLGTVRKRLPTRAKKPFPGNWSLFDRGREVERWANIESFAFAWSTERRHTIKRLIGISSNPSFAQILEKIISDRERDLDLLKRAGGLHSANLSLPLAFQ